MASINLPLRAGPARAGAGGNVELSREVLEDPVRAEHRTAVGASREAHVVARARVHRQLALDRIPVVVLLDEDVQVVEPPRARQGPPAPLEGARLRAALLPEGPVGAGQPLPLGRDALVDLLHALHPARADPGLEVGLDGALGLARAARQRAPARGGAVGGAAQQPLGGSESVVAGDVL